MALLIPNGKLLQSEIQTETDRHIDGTLIFVALQDRHLGQDKGCPTQQNTNAIDSVYGC